MVEITEAARRELDGYFADKEKAPIRIYLSAGGCSGPRLALALDEAKDTADLFEAGGYQFIVDKDLAVQAAPMRVDMSYMGLASSRAWSLAGAAAAAPADRAPRNPAAPGVLLLVALRFSGGRPDGRPHFIPRRSHTWSNSPMPPVSSSTGISPTRKKTPSASISLPAAEPVPGFLWLWTSRRTRMISSMPADTPSSWTRNFHPRPAPCGWT